MLRREVQLDRALSPRQGAHAARGRSPTWQLQRKRWHLVQGPGDVARTCFAEGVQLHPRRLRPAAGQQRAASFARLPASAAIPAGGAPVRRSAGARSVRRPDTAAAAAAVRSGDCWLCATPTTRSSCHVNPLFDVGRRSCTSSRQSRARPSEPCTAYSQLSELNSTL